MDFGEEGLNVIPLNLSLRDCGHGKQSRSEFEFTVRLKIHAIKQMLEAGFVPAKSHGDGRVIMRAPEGMVDKFVQMHVRQEGEDWAIVCYPCETEEGREMLTLEQQLVEFPDARLNTITATENEDGSVDFGEPTLRTETEGCNCPACTVRRALGKVMPEEMGAQQEPGDDKRTLH